MKATNERALKEWSIVCRFLHEAEGILTFVKELPTEERSFALLPAYEGIDVMALKPHVALSWRHELKAPLTGHVYVRDVVVVTDVLPISSTDVFKSMIFDAEHAFRRSELERRFAEGERPGLLALALRLYHLPRSYRLADRMSFEAKPGPLVELPVAIETEGAVPELDDADYERRLGAVRRVLTEASEAA